MPAISLAIEAITIFVLTFTPLNILYYTFMVLENMSNIKPSLIITYSRPKNCMNLIDSLYKQGCKRIYIAIDFGKFDEITAKQSEYELLESIYSDKFERFEVWRRTENLGVAASVITAIDWFFKNEDSGVILEDDLVISKDFLGFLSEGLEEFRNNKNIFSVSGSNFFPALTSEDFLTEYFIGWGWGTWRDRWEKAKISYLSDIARPVFSFNEFANFWNIGSYRSKIGKVDTWDIELTKFIRDNKFVCVISSSNLVSNIGYDEHASSTKLNKFPLGIPISKSVLRRKTYKDLKINVGFDAALEKKVFGIKFIHKFLLFTYYRFTFHKRLKNTPLASRLKNIITP